MQDAQRCGRGVSAILSEKWRLNSSCGCERRPSGTREMSVHGRCCASPVFLSVFLRHLSPVWHRRGAVLRTAMPVSSARAPEEQPQLFVVLPPRPPPPPCLFGKPVVRMRVTIALVSACAEENIQDSFHLWTRCFDSPPDTFSLSLIYSF